MNRLKEAILDQLHWFKKPTYQDLVLPSQEIDAIKVGIRFYYSLMDFLAREASTRLKFHGASPEQLGIITSLHEYLKVQRPSIRIRSRGIAGGKFPVITLEHSFNYPKNSNTSYTYLCNYSVIPNAHPDTGLLGRSDQYIHKLDFLILPAIPQTPEEFSMYEALPSDPSIKFGMYRRGELIVRRMPMGAKKNSYEASHDFHYLGFFTDHKTHEDRHVWVTMGNPKIRYVDIF